MNNKNYIAAHDRYSHADTMYRRCGNSGILLPKISLGMWHNFGSNDPFERSRRMLLTAFDKGITHIDLANNYGPPSGSAEETFGKIITTDLAPYRDELFISTKAGYDMWEGPYGSWCSRKQLISSIDQSLRRMKVEYVDLFYIHRYDPLTPLDESLQAIVDIIRSGKALYAGISRWPLEALRYAQEYLRARDVPPLIYQGRLNLLDRAPQHEGILDYCHSEGIGFISFSPLAQGLLTNRYDSGIPEDSRMSRNRTLKKETLTPELQQQLSNLRHVAQERGESMAQTALAWVMQQQGVTSVLVGASSTEQLSLNINAIHSAPFSDEQLKRLTFK